jgi:acetyl esterase/lipase
VRPKSSIRSFFPIDKEKVNMSQSRQIVTFLLLGIAANVCGSVLLFGQTVSYPDHSNLLVLRDATGAESTITTKDAWKNRVGHIRSNMQLVMGALPDESRRVALNVQILSDESTPKYQRRKVLFTPEPDDRVPAWLLIPHGISEKQSNPAMLCLHQTNHVGKDEPAGLGGLPNLHYAHELAEQGFVCVVPDYPSFGEYKYDFKTQGAHYASGSMKAIWNNIRAIDLLETLPQVDRSRIGVIGHSLGGHNALFTSFFDDRLKATVTSCGFTPFHDYYKGDLKGWTSDRYMPRIRDIYNNDPDKVPFDFYEILAGLAPRGCYSNSPIHDSNFEVEGVRKAFKKAGEVFSIFKSPGQLKLATPDAQHDFPKAQRDEAYAWLKDQLK